MTSLATRRKVTTFVLGLVGLMAASAPPTARACRRDQTDESGAGLAD